MSGATDPYKGTTLEGVGTLPLDVLSEDCGGSHSRSYLVRPLFEVSAERVVPGRAVGMKSCCAGTVTEFCYITWMPHLKGCRGFVVLEVTDDTP